MRSIQKVTPINAPGARELRRLAYESTADNFAMLARFAETAEGLNLVNIFHNAYAAKSTIHAEAQRREERLAVLQWILENVDRVGLRPQRPRAALTKAPPALLAAQTLRQKMEREP